MLKTFLVIGLGYMAVAAMTGILIGILLIMVLALELVLPGAWDKFFRPEVYYPVVGVIALLCSFFYAGHFYYFKEKRITLFVVAWIASFVPILILVIREYISKTR